MSKTIDFEESTCLIPAQRTVVPGDGDAPRFAISIPEGYAPGYAYPLVIYLHDDGTNESQISKWFPAVTDRNCIAVGLRAPFLDRWDVAPTFQWRTNLFNSYASLAASLVERVAEDWSINRDRVILFGEGRGGMAALSLLESAPENYAGLIGVDIPAGWQRIVTSSGETMPRAFLADRCPTGIAKRCAIALAERGSEVTVYETDIRDNDPELCNAINRWMMAAISTTIW